jgi:dTMP kinase
VPPARGRFISIEGIEGSGKSTLRAGLVAELRGYAAGTIPTVETREPGGTALGERVRALFLDPAGRIEARAEALLLNAARAQLVRETIAPALAAGNWVVSDRFSTSTLAYQGYGRGLELDGLHSLAAFATGGLEPDLVLLVDIPPEVSRERLRGRPGADDRVEREDDAFHARVRAGYLELAAGDARMRVLDGMLAPDELLRAAFAHVERLIAS